MKLKDWILILVLAGDATLLYFAKIDLTTIALLALTVVIFRFLRAPMYTKIEKRIRSRVKIVSIYPEWAVRLIILVFFITAVVLLKWLVFEVFKLFGFDVGQTLTEKAKPFVKWVDQRI